MALMAPSGRQHRRGRVLSGHKPSQLKEVKDETRVIDGNPMALALPGPDRAEAPFEPMTKPAADISHDPHQH